MKVSMWFRENNILYQGRDFRLQGNYIFNGCVRYWITDQELETLLDGYMIMHENSFIAMLFQEHDN